MYVSKYLPSQQKYAQNCLLMIFWILKRYVTACKKNYDQLRDKSLVSHFLFCIVI